MTLSRAASLVLFALIANCAVAADPNSTSTITWEPPRQVAGDPPRPVPWFTGMSRSTTNLSGGGAVSGEGSVARWLDDPEHFLSQLRSASCLKLRVYKVKRQEHFRGNESGFVGYSTCQLASNYQVRSAVQTLQQSSH